MPADGAVAETGSHPRARLRAVLAQTTQRLGRAGVPSPSTDARALIARAAGTEGPLVLLEELPEAFDAELERLTARREHREPLQLILGRAPFRGLMLRVRAGVFIPRPETELIIDLLREHHDPATGPLERVVDLCTGGGAAAAAVLDEFPSTRVLAVDVDQTAADLARENLEAAGPGRGRVLRADLTGPDALAGHGRRGGADAVIANPPYVPADAIPRDPEVRAFDPGRALYGGGADGMELPRAVIAWARHLLRPGGVLIMEHADVQGRAARDAARQIGGLDEVATAPDLTGRDRFLLARRAAGEHDDGSETLSR